jgi:hypothetical protein
MLRGLPGGRATRTLLRRSSGARARLFLLTRVWLGRCARSGGRRLRDDDGLIRRARLRGDRQGYL